MSKEERVRAVAGVTVIVVISAGIWLTAARPWESADEYALRFCRTCGVKPELVIELIGETRRDRLNEGDIMKRFYNEFLNFGDEKLCTLCARAIVRAAEIGDSQE